MTGLVFAGAAAYGVYLIFTSVTGSTSTPTRYYDNALATAVVRRLRAFARSTGLDAIPVRESLTVGTALSVVVGALAYTLFGAPVVALVAALFGAATPVASARARRERRRSEGREAWPRLIEEIRVLSGAAGYPLPAALLTAGQRAPRSLQPAFQAASREWRLTTDFSRTLDVLKEQLDDATTDAVCETLLVAFEVGGTDVDRRLAALVEDRVQDLQGRKDAAAKQAGVRFARRFVLIVPLGMAVAGLSIGTGRAAYATSFGQLLVLAGVGVLAVCWIWAGRLMCLPAEERVFSEARR